MPSDFLRPVSLQLGIKVNKIFIQLTLKIFWSQNVFNSCFFLSGAGTSILFFQNPITTLKNNFHHYFLPFLVMTKSGLEYCGHTVDGMRLRNLRKKNLEYNVVLYKICFNFISL